VTAAADLVPLPGELMTAGEMPQPGSWRSALYRKDAPGAALDGQPWAASWGQFLRAVADPEDSSARQHIANVMASRPQNAAFGERIPAEGGFLVPEVLRSQVLSYMTPALVRPRAMVLPMAGLRLPIPALDNPSQASGAQALGGLTFSFTAEGAPIASSTPAFGRAVLEARKLAALMAVPDELAGDAAGAFGDFTARVIAMGLAWVEDDYFIGTSGTGAGCPQSLLNAPCAVSVTRTGGSFVLADIASMVKALHPASKQAGFTSGVTDVCWLVSSSALDVLLEMYVTIGTASNTATGAAAWLSLGDGNEVGPSLLGLPMLVTDHQPLAGTAGDVALADLRHFLIGDRLEMTIERSRAGSGFPADISNYRIKSRVDGRYWIQSSSTTEAGQNVSPVVVLH